MEIKKIFNIISKYSISPNQLYLMYCIKNKIPPVGINIAVEKRIIPEGWIVDSGLSIKALNLLKQLDGLPISASSVILSDDNILKYNSIFPKIKLPSGKLARSDINNLRNSFKWFIEKHSYDWEVIIRATETYVDEYEKKNYLYMRTSMYFIRKQEPDKTFLSELANYCALITSGGTTDEKTSFSEKVV